MGGISSKWFGWSDQKKKKLYEVYVRVAYQAHFQWSTSTALSEAEKVLETE